MLLLWYLSTPKFINPIDETINNFYYLLPSKRMTTIFNRPSASSSSGSVILAGQVTGDSSQTVISTHAVLSKQLQGLDTVTQAPITDQDTILNSIGKLTANSIAATSTLDEATDWNIPNTIVRRSATGGFACGGLNLNDRTVTKSIFTFDNQVSERLLALWDSAGNENSIDKTLTNFAGLGTGAGGTLTFNIPTGQDFQFLRGSVDGLTSTKVMNLSGSGDLNVLGDIASVGSVSATGRIDTANVLWLGDQTQNKLIVLHRSGSDINDQTGTNFMGFGMNGGILRYQVALSGQNHRFYGGNVEQANITGTGITTPFDVTATGAITGGSISTAGSIIATGAGSFNSLYSVNNVYGKTMSSETITLTKSLHVTDPMGLPTSSVFSGIITADQIVCNGSVSMQTLDVTGDLTAPNITASTSLTTPQVNCSSTVTTQSLSVTNPITATSGITLPGGGTLAHYEEYIHGTNASAVLVGPAQFKIVRIGSQVTMTLASNLADGAGFTSVGGSIIQFSGAIPAQFRPDPVVANSMIIPIRIYQSSAQAWGYVSVSTTGVMEIQLEGVSNSGLVVHRFSASWHTA